MAARNDESLLFLVEWFHDRSDIVLHNLNRFDNMPQLKRKYLLKYFIKQNMVIYIQTLEIIGINYKVEMVDLKSKKTFLKK